ncbi:MAG: hypothetical protein ACT4QF_02785 [Sporichthyaceae bacterium]
MTRSIFSIPTVGGDHRHGRRWRRSYGGRRRRYGGSRRHGHHDDWYDYGYGYGYRTDTHTW